jgi:carboxyl-terminal processing protease
MRSLRILDGEIYISNDQYTMLSRYLELHEVEKLVGELYYQDTDRDDLLTGAKRGLVYALNDPYSTFYTKEELTSLYDRLEGIFTGLGIIISQNKDKNAVEIQRVYPNSPAEDADLKVGDIIVIVDGEPVVGLDIDTVAGKIRGPDGTTVSLTIHRNNESITKEIGRRPFETDKAAFQILDDQIGYINIFEFTGNCVDIFKQAKESMEKEDVTSLIIDIRDNPGGKLEDVREIADMLLPQGIIYYTVNKNNEKIVKESDAAFWDIPLVILVNKKSASASEVLAGAVQDYDGRGTIIGETTFGKAVVQEIISIPKTGEGVKITTAIYYTPNGRMINGTGIEPDILISQEKGGTLENDLQLLEAIKILKGL